MDEKQERRKLPMDPGEILRDYMASKTPLKQIGILAELNACTRQEIVEILEAQGAPLPRVYKSKAPSTPPPVWRCSRPLSPT